MRQESPSSAVWPRRRDADLVRHALRGRLAVPKQLQDLRARCEASATGGRATRAGGIPARWGTTNTHEHPRLLGDRRGRPSSCPSARVQGVHASHRRAGARGRAFGTSPTSFSIESRSGAPSALVDDYAFPLPDAVIAELLGIPIKRWRSLPHLVELVRATAGHRRAARAVRPASTTDSWRVPRRPLREAPRRAERRPAERARGSRRAWRPPLARTSSTAWPYSSSSPGTRPP